MPSVDSEDGGRINDSHAAIATYARHPSRSGLPQLQIQLRDLATLRARALHLSFAH
jgi:hypothetical protein